MLLSPTTQTNTLCNTKYIISHTNAHVDAHTHTHTNHFQFVYENKILKRTSVSIKRLEKKADPELLKVSRIP